jgi:hypothetical protein
MPVGLPPEGAYGWPLQPYTWDPPPPYGTYNGTFAPFGAAYLPHGAPPVQGAPGGPGHAGHDQGSWFAGGPPAGYPGEAGPNSPGSGGLSPGPQAAMWPPGLLPWGAPRAPPGYVAAYPLPYGGYHVPGWGALPPAVASGQMSPPPSPHRA